MFKNIVLALIAFMAFSALAENVSTNLPANTINIRALVDGKDLISVRGDKIWITHVEGEFPTNVIINGNSWKPVLENENESDTFTMKNPSRFMPMGGQRTGLIFMSIKPTDVEVSVFEYPDEFNEWILTLSLENSNSGNQSLVDVTISWKEDKEPIDLQAYYVPTTKPSPTPVGLR